MRFMRTAQDTEGRLSRQTRIKDMPVTAGEAGSRPKREIAPKTSAIPARALNVVWPSDHDSGVGTVTIEISAQTRVNDDPARIL
jgi:hypothetical protein